MARFDIPEESYDTGNTRFAIVASRWNEDVVGRLLQGALDGFADHGVSAEDVLVVRVPGAYEIPIAAQRVAARGMADAVVTLGAVVRGDTPHFDYVAGECASGVSRVALDHSIPVIFGVLTCDDQAQALARAGGTEGNKGRESALAAMEMATLLRRLGES